MNSTAKASLTGNLACLAAYLIFGFNIVCCKNIANDGHVPPMSLFLMRSAGALVLFWVMSLCLPEARRERVERGDLWKIAVASLLGLFLTQFAFLKAITMTPVMTMVVAAVVLKDRITWQGVVGLGVSLPGVLFIVLNSVTGASGAEHTSFGGVLLMFVNATAFACYVGVFKPIIQKYHVVTFMKWMFLFSTLYALPFSGGVLSIEYGAIPWNIVLQILYVVVGATFVAYFLIPVGQKRLKPVLVCMYSYVQPVVAMCISLAVGLDTMTWAKGVGIVNFSPHAHHHAKALHHNI